MISKPEPRKTSSIRWLSREHVGLETIDPLFARDLGQPFQESRPDPAPLCEIGDREGDFRDGRTVCAAKVVRDADDVAAELSDETEIVVVVDVHRRSIERRGGRARIEEPGSQAGGGE